MLINSIHHRSKNPKIAPSKIFFDVFTIKTFEAMKAATSNIPIFAPGEGNKILLLAVTMCTLAHYRRKIIRQRWLGNDVNESPRLVDHPAFCYLLENISCFGTAYLIERLLPTVDRNRPIFSFLIIYLRGLLAVDPLLLFEKFCAVVVYKHVPYFSAKKPPQDIATLVKDYFACNFTASVVNLFIQIAIFYRLSPKMEETLIHKPSSLRLVPFIAKFLFCRIIVDITFGIAHRIMHENNWVYENIHKVHRKSSSFWFR